MTRRHCLLAAAGLALPDAPLTASYYHARRQFVKTRYGRIAYIKRGAGPVAVFLHGLPLNGFQWRGILPRLAPHRLCLAPDFLGLGYTETRPDQDLSPVIQAGMIAEFLRELAVDRADIIANDSGGAVAQLLAARHPALVRTLLLTNCDVDTNSPPAAMAPELALARRGELAALLQRQLADKSVARGPRGLGGVCFTNPNNLTGEAVDYYFTPLVATAARRAQLHRYMLSFLPNPLVPVRTALRRCHAPARMVWGTGDRYFGLEWARWLDRTLPQSRGVLPVEGAKLFFPEERPELIAREALFLWKTAPAV